MRFLVDSMCGGLARWLRILGQDAAYERDADDAALAERAKREGRVLLTRDRKLLERRAARGGHLVAGVGTMEELLGVVRAFGLPLDGPGLFSRCIVCNEPSRDLPKAEVEGRVPPYVHRTQERFRGCDACGRIYWAATHRDHALARLREAATARARDAGGAAARGPDPRAGGS